MGAHVVVPLEPSSVSRLITALAQRGIVAEFASAGGGMYAIFAPCRDGVHQVTVFDSGLNNALYREHEHTDDGRVQWAVQVEQIGSSTQSSLVADGIPLGEIDHVAALIAKEVQRLKDLEIGTRVRVKVGRSGSFTGVVASWHPGFPEGIVAMIEPEDAAVRQVWPEGYDIGRAHWPSTLEILP